MEGAAICPRQPPERDWLPVEALGERCVCLEQLPPWFKPGGGCGSVCRAAGMSPLQAGAIPLQHVQGAARQASSARRKSEAQDAAFQKHPYISPLGSDLRGTAAVWAPLGPWQPRDTHKVTWEHQSPKHLQVSPPTSVSTAVVCWHKGRNCKT